MLQIGSVIRGITADSLPQWRGVHVSPLEYPAQHGMARA